MTIRFLADEDLRAAFVEALRSREKSIDILNVKTDGLRGTKDAALLELAFAQRRIVLSHDRQTMVGQYFDRAARGQGTSGLCIFDQHANVGEIVDALLLIWAASHPEEWRNRIIYLPFR